DVSPGRTEWRQIDVRSGGMARVTSAQPDAMGGSGSLELQLPAP
ncbi:unnamed protein product, partial [Laminaria digitata]